jgi:hypothetical protein
MVHGRPLGLVVARRNGEPPGLSVEFLALSDCREVLLVLATFSLGAVLGALAPRAEIATTAQEQV